jgi:YbgC/YbaW family acyl-CoA thioester hydrolase
MHIAEKEIQITYADTDMMGVIYHGNYVKWLELGRTQLVEDAGFSYLEMESQGYYAPVYNLEITYKKPIKLGDRAFVKTWVEVNQGLRTVYGLPQPDHLPPDSADPEPDYQVHNADDQAVLPPGHLINRGCS